MGRLTSVGGLFDTFFDDAAIFPPGSLALPEAVRAHQAHRTSPHAALVGPFVVAASALDALAARTADLPRASFDIALTVTAPGAVRDALGRADRVPALLVRSIEVAVPVDVAVTDVVPALDAALTGRSGIEVFVELPRDARRGDLVAELSHTAYLAKLRCGGVRADLHPDERELADVIVRLVRARVPFKATAGLHHAVRNTDARTGFEQHGFLNIMSAVACALDGADVDTVAQLLATRDGDGLASRSASLAFPVGALRKAFRSVGTCSIDEPVTDLVDLDLLTTTEGAPVP